MAKSTLKQIILTSFRGASLPATIEFDPERNVTMVFGENGTGKSSIVDAFSFVCERRLGSLEERSGAENKHIASICGKSGSLRVKLVTTCGPFEAALHGRKIAVTPASGCPDVRVLRRSQILRLIDRQPKERFEALREYIEVPGIERSEKGLRDAVNGTNDELNGQAQAYTQAQAALVKLWETEGRPGGSAEDWARAEKAKDLTLLKNQCIEIDTLLETIRDLERMKTAWQTAEQKVASAKAAHGRAVEEQKAEEQKVIGQNAALLALLWDAKAYVVTEPTDFCPVCQQPVEAVKLAGELDSRIASMSTLSKATSATDTLKRALDTAISSLATAASEYATALSGLAGALTTSKLQAVSNVAVPEETSATLSDGSLPVPDRLAVATGVLDLLPEIKNALGRQKETAQKSIAQQLEMHVQHIEAGRTQEDILFEILLKSGFPLGTRIESLTLAGVPAAPGAQGAAQAGKTVFSIAEGVMLICLEKELTPEVIKEIAARKPERVVCLDAGFAGNDQLKTNAAQTFKAKGVTSFRTV